ncbi:hypothetical protein FACS189443_1820 [Planctomycetales bacterium]|nr:hypothetical protein FACS189443_1820 [Planctomycetales bacterium]
MTTFTLVFTAVSYAWKYKSLLWGLVTFPKRPTDWKSSSQVRTFINSYCKSYFGRSLARITPTKWDDNALDKFQRLSDDPYVWDTCWAIFISQQNQREILIIKTLRQRIQDKFRELFPIFRADSRKVAAVSLQVEELLPILQAVTTIYAVGNK